MSGVSSLYSQNRRAFFLTKIDLITKSLKITSILFEFFCVRFDAPFFGKKPNFQNGQKTWENRTNMDIILLILVKRLDKHGTTVVHITYPLLISVLIFAMFSKTFTYVVGKNVFLQFIAVKIPCQSFYKKQRREKVEEKVWPPAREMKFFNVVLGIDKSQMSNSKF